MLNDNSAPVDILDLVRLYADNSWVDSTRSILHQAADEIARQRAEVERWKRLHKLESDRYDNLAGEVFMERWRNIRAAADTCTKEPS